MKRTSRPGNPGLWDRLACAFGSLFFSVPVCGLLWIATNYQLVSTGWSIGPEIFAWAVGGLALLAFALPRLFSTVFGWLADAAFAIGRYW